MTELAKSTIDRAMGHWANAKKVSPPCPVFTAAAINEYDTAIAQLVARRHELQRILDAERTGDALSSEHHGDSGGEP